MTTNTTKNISSIRKAVVGVPSYPFNPVDATIKLDQNENPYDFPEELKKETLARMNSASWNRYPDLHADTMREAIAKYENWDAGGIVVTSGSNVMIKLLTELGGISQTILTTNPTFGVYSLEASMLDANLVQISLNPDFSLPVEAMVSEMQKGQGVCVVTQPHAPTGHLDNTDDLNILIQAAEAHGWIMVIDEAYHQFCDRDIRELIKSSQNVISVRTFSKAWGLAGARAGYILTSTYMANQIQKLCSAFNMSIFTQLAIEVALENPNYMQLAVKEIKFERNRIMEALQKNNKFEIIPSSANFFLIRSSNIEALYTHLLKNGIVTRRQDGLHLLSGCLRITIGSPSENDHLLQALATL